MRQFRDPPTTRQQGKQFLASTMLLGILAADCLIHSVVDYTTITSYCPVTETKTEGGSTYEVTWTSTSVGSLRGHEFWGLADSE